MPALRIYLISIILIYLFAAPYLISTRYTQYYNFINFSQILLIQPFIGVLLRAFNISLSVTRWVSRPIYLRQAFVRFPLLALAWLCRRAAINFPLLSRSARIITSLRRLRLLFPHFVIPISIFVSIFALSQHSPPGSHLALHASATLTNSISHYNSCFGAVCRAHFRAFRQFAAINSISSSFAFIFAISDRHFPILALSGHCQFRGLLASTHSCRPGPAWAGAGHSAWHRLAGPGIRRIQAVLYLIRDFDYCLFRVSGIYAFYGIFHSGPGILF